MNITKAKNPQHDHKSVSSLCSYLLRHEKRMSHGNDGGVAIPAILSDMRRGAGRDSCRP